MILVTGATGFVGQKIMALCENTVACPSLRNATEAEVRRLVEESGAEAIIHTAAISDIGACEKDPEASYRANVLLPLWLAKAAKGRKLVCFSSDQVYSGLEDEGPYPEERVSGAHVYARHKIEMERRVLDLCPQAVMLRAQWMYDHFAQRPNYLQLVLNAQAPLRFSSRHYRGVAYLREVAENMPAVLRLPGGSYNFGSETAQSMHAITRDFLTLLGKPFMLEDGPAPHNLWLDCRKARRLGVDFSTVEKGLRRCAEDYGLIPR